MVMLTSLYLGLLGFIYLKISMDTIKARKRHQVSLGHGENNEILGYVSAHSNFQAYVPMIGLLMYLYEISALSYAPLIHAIGLTVLAGRAVHYLGVREANAQNFKLRVAGMHMTLWPLIVLASLNIANFYYITKFKN